MCPSAFGQIQTSCHAGGIASARMRPSVATSRTGRPRESLYENPVPLRCRRIPGVLSSTYRSPAARAACRDSARSRSTSARAFDSTSRETTRSREALLGSRRTCMETHKGKRCANGGNRPTYRSRDSLNQNASGGARMQLRAAYPARPPPTTSSSAARNHSAEHYWRSIAPSA
jgi:hypothetical protein